MLPASRVLVAEMTRETDVGSWWAGLIAVFAVGSMVGALYLPLLVN